MNEYREKTLQQIRWLIWLYFWLLLIEGALRKWVVPQLSNPLLIVRDPVVLLAFGLAIRARIFPTNRWVISLGIIAACTFVITLFILWPYLPPTRLLLLDGYGLRSNFLHLPFIFVMARVLRPEDLKKFGWWTLLLVAPMALLMVGQFQSPPDSFLNRTTGGEGDEMMLSAMGKVRTAGPFSFVIGVVAYFALATGFLIWAALKRDIYKLWLLVAAGSGLAIGTAVSGSRSVVGACALVVASLLVVFILRPGAVNRFGQTLLMVLVFGFVVVQTPIFKEGFKVLSTRFNEVAEATEKSIGGSLIERVLGDFEDGFSVFTKAPFWGYGLGVGTNAGAKFLTGQSTFLLSETEWSRLFLESGPLLGLAFVIWRCAFAVNIGLLCLRSVKKFGNLLPLLLFSSSAWPLMSGQFGQPTVLGFTVFVTGLALAARNGEALGSELSRPGEESHPRPAPPRVPRRSPYAERLHGPSTQSDHAHGPVDR